MTQARLMEVLRYNTDTGIFTWQNSKGTAKSGSIAGCVDARGRRYISVDGTLYIASRLAWLYVYGQWPSGEIDHRDRNPSNDSIHNLRDATHIQNTYNRKKKGSHLKGCHWNCRAKKWQAQIGANSKSIHLGCFDSEREAHEAYAKAAGIYHGEFAAIY